MTTRPPPTQPPPAHVEPVRVLPGRPEYGPMARSRWPALMTPSEVAHRLRLDDERTAPHDPPDRD